MLLRAAASLLRQADKFNNASAMVRSFASAAPAKVKESADIKLPTPPLQLYGMSASIATLVWQIASKENVLDKVQDEIHQFSEAILTLPDLRRMATDPLFPPIVRKAVIDKVLKDSTATEVTKRLFSSLAEENVLAATFDIAKAFDDLQLAHKKEIYCTIVTAQPLDKMERDEVRKEALKYVEKGFKLVAKEKVDKKILGGFVLEFEDRLVDMSDSKKDEEYRTLVDKLERDLLG
ncbi:hypothetical protein CEUSTIGMA_g7528.t1 [Chlamydomonas eustigma]|uniref:ATP synthase subunit O, mitochondrial n=1 Tax=Chlamydomonas eustigma TaxID=1157962 RepID=A0A250XBE7_9CHLO|nr:hypothetical protein CEUSTIGMA_g7528.t1 [Chlamydomonas eustigma]|eukprot:GAX80090.1 hypothetical protein CEUSTIGMA_g7528.t1 [Chlamydomonas eustigma]